MAVGDTVWTETYVVGASTAVGMPSNDIFSKNWVEIGPFGAGTSIIRSRIEGYIKLGVVVLPAGTGSSYQAWCEGVKIDVGVYCNPTMTSTAPGQTADTSERDGYWLQLNAMTLDDISEWTDKDGAQHQTATYKLLNGVSDSKAKRGPGVAGYSAWLVWNIATSIVFYNLDDTDYEGNGGGMIKASVLTDLLA